MEGEEEKEDKAEQPASAGTTAIAVTMRSKPRRVPRSGVRLQPRLQPFASISHYSRPSPSLTSQAADPGARDGSKALQKREDLARMRRRVVPQFELLLSDGPASRRSHRSQ